MYKKKARNKSLVSPRASSNHYEHVLMMIRFSSTNFKYPNMQDVFIKCNIKSFISWKM